MAPIPNLYAISKVPQLANCMTPHLHFSLVLPPWNLYHWVIPTGLAIYTYHIMKPEAPPIATLFVYTLHPGDLPSSNTAASAQFTRVRHLQSQRFAVSASFLPSPIPLILSVRPSSCRVTFAILPISPSFPLLLVSAGLALDWLPPTVIVFVLLTCPVSTRHVYS